MASCCWSGCGSGVESETEPLKVLKEPAAHRAATEEVCLGIAADEGVTDPRNGIATAHTPNLYLSACCRSPPTHSPPVRMANVGVKCVCRPATFPRHVTVELTIPIYEHNGRSLRPHVYVLQCIVLYFFFFSRLPRQANSSDKSCHVVSRYPPTAEYRFKIDSNRFGGKSQRLIPSRRGTDSTCNRNRYQPPTTRSREDDDDE